MGVYMYIYTGGEPLVRTPWICNLRKRQSICAGNVISMQSAGRVQRKNSGMSRKNNKIYSHNARRNESGIMGDGCVLLPIDEGGGTPLKRS